MNWSTPADLRAQAQKLWERGDLLASLVTGEAIFPKRLTLKCPTSAEISAHFEQVRVWNNALRAMPHCRITLREFRHRQFGANELPHEAWIDSAADALALIGRQREAGRFAQLLALTRQRQPQLLAWLAKRPMRGLELNAEWPLLLDIVCWLQAHPRPGIYLRQVDIPGVHSKFIEAQRGVLSELFDLSLAPGAIEASASGSGQFTRRYGFRDKPLRIRLRVLDPAHALLSAPATRGESTPDDAVQDVTLDAATFALLDCKVTQVFITENEVNFLAFPPCRNSLVIFGAGYGFEMLRPAAWLARCRIQYWGDIDTHGFAILDQLRSQFAQAESFLMDRATLLAFRALWGREETPATRDLTRLNDEELALYNDLRDQRIGCNVRLEQERIGFGRVTAALARLEATRFPDLPYNGNP